ncbi:MAG TPA: hypothetical protein VH349_04025 [Ktedonobacterales bacterium]|jgi:hypothetical protein
MQQQWEYFVDIPTLDDVPAYLNSMGEQGWELVTVGDVGVEPKEAEINAPKPLQFVFKRPKGQP